MPDIDFTKLNRQQKLAVFLICVGPEAAADVLRHFDDAEIEALCREMSTLTMIPESTQKQAMEEFGSVVASSIGSALGGMPFAQRTLEIAKGDYKASSILGRVGPVSNSVDVMSDVAEMEGRQIFNLLKNEQPQTLSFVLSYLEPVKAAQVFALLSPEMREDVVERLGTIESTSLEHVGKIVRSLGKHFDTKARPVLHHSGGVRAVAGLLNSLDKEMSKNLLARIEERNATLGAAIRKKLFSFEDLNRLAAGDLQRVLREVDSGNLAISMKSASEVLRDKIYGGLSKRAAESLKEEIDLLGPVRLKDVEAAQEVIIQAVRRLEEEGQISIDADSQALVG
ncbi:MAG: flagellar motor switch protein FliG [Candidatus Didemnitutus sp.]|nr:flagellar motor switch protein FliG [Candidatus Didemnitutus sp.]